MTLPRSGTQAPAEELSVQRHDGGAHRHGGGRGKRCKFIETNPTARCLILQLWADSGKSGHQRETEDAHSRNSNFECWLRVRCCAEKREACTTPSQAKTPENVCPFSSWALLLKPRRLVGQSRHKKKCASNRRCEERYLKRVFKTHHPSGAGPKRDESGTILSSEHYTTNKQIALMYDDHRTRSDRCLFERSDGIDGDTPDARVRR